MVRLFSNFNPTELMPTLFDSICLGEISLPNRIIMAPLTRTRAPGRVPNALMLEYYVQRASAGMILTEATAISPSAVGYPDTPGIWSEEQVEAWRRITDAVHAAGGKIVCQLWHVGRVSHPVYLNGNLPVAPSAIALSGHVSLLRPETPHVTPRALELEEIPGIIEDYRKAAENAKRAGFDGVEIHGANGYLPDQFLNSGSNKRTDAYGGPVENRARFLLEATDAAISVWGPGRVGVHLSPHGTTHEMHDDNPRETYLYVARELGERKIAFIFTREYEREGELFPEIRRESGVPLIANEKLTQERAEAILAEGKADAVSFGLAFIANPDLPARFAQKAPLNEVNFETLYAKGAVGYTDYPFLPKA